MCILISLLKLKLLLLILQVILLFLCPSSHSLYLIRILILLLNLLSGRKIILKSILVLLCLKLIYALELICQLNLIWINGVNIRLKLSNKIELVIHVWNLTIEVVIICSIRIKRIKRRLLLPSHHLTLIQILVLKDSLRLILLGLKLINLELIVKTL